MPKQPTAHRQAARPAPYNLRTSTAMVSTIPTPMQWHNQAGIHGYGYSDHGMTYNHQLMAPYLQPAPNTMPTIPHMQRNIPLKPGQSGPWNPNEDSVLIEAKANGMSWEEIHQQHFPGKSANACRKRHERVLAKLKSTDWDEARIKTVIDAYNRHRDIIWAPLCNEIGESLSDVEKVMFQQGPRHLRNPARGHARHRSRASSGHAALSEYERGSSADEPQDHTDDSGISLGVPGQHSRRQSIMAPALSTESLPSLGHVLSDTNYNY